MADRPISETKPTTEPKAEIKTRSIDKDAEFYQQSNCGFW